jgi:hypothetical protein
MNKNEIITTAENCFHKFSENCNRINDSALFQKTGNKWSAAENIQHLILSIKMTTLAFRLPKLIIRMVGGKPNRSSRSYEELKVRYYKKLEDGGKASAKYIPKPIEIKYGKQKLMDNWQNVTAGFINALIKKNQEDDLDNYLVKHPLLGRITLRELCYFTIFHTEHHLQVIYKISTIL